MTIEFHLYLPQLRFGFDALVARAQAAEAAGFDGIALMDHLAPPMAESQPMYEAFVTATWLAAHTQRLTIAHLVLCDSLRHPAVLARQAVSLDHASGGRFELGLGSGSVPAELARFGAGSASARERTDRLAETLAVVEALWTGEAVDHRGSHHTIVEGLQRPVPLSRIPIVIGGTGPRTMALVAAHADWWNLPMADLERLDELRPLAGAARVSAHQLVTLVPDDASRDDVLATAQRRFGFTRRSGWVAGGPDELVRHFRAFHERGVERFYTWFTDFADLDTLARFGTDVIDRLRAG